MTDKKRKKRCHTLGTTATTYGVRKTEKIRQELRAARHSLGLTQREAAKLIGVARQTFGHWEVGFDSMRIRKSTVEKWRRGLDAAAAATEQSPVRVAKLRTQPAASAKPRRTTSSPKAAADVPRPAATPASSTDQFLVSMVALFALLALFVAVASLTIVLW
jgi:DNA-binding XRE family transcriptional regulator